MATHAVTLSSTGPMGDVEDMTDEQMQELLAQAASRLQQKAQLQEARKEQDFKIPKLGTGEIARTYTTSKSGVARMDGGAQVADKERSLSNRIRKVEDPVTVSKRKAEVSLFFFFLRVSDSLSLHTLFLCLGGRFNPNFYILSRVEAPSWFVFLHYWKSFIS